MMRLGRLARQVKDALEEAEDEKNHLLSELLDLFEPSS